MDRIDGELTTEQARQVLYIESSARDLQELVNDLLDLAKVEAGKARIRSKRFSVNELFSALKGMLKPLLADNNSVELVFEETEGLPELRTDEGKVSQILRNLVSNAIKFTPKGSVTVSASMLDGFEVLFTVRDTGIGIAPENHETIINEFSQVENPLQERYRGTGLGLPLCRNLTMLLGGRIWLEPLRSPLQHYCARPRSWPPPASSPVPLRTKSTIPLKALLTCPTSRSGPTPSTPFATSSNRPTSNWGASAASPSRPCPFIATPTLRFSRNTGGRSASTTKRKEAVGGGPPGAEGHHAG